MVHGLPWNAGRSGEKTLKVVLACVTTVFKVPHREVPLGMAVGQPQQQARISTLLLEYSRSREGLGTTLQDPCQSEAGLRLPGAHKESHDIHISPLSPAIRYWWVGRLGRWTEKTVAVAHVDPDLFWKVLLNMPSL